MATLDSNWGLNECQKTRPTFLNWPGGFIASPGCSDAIRVRAQFFNSLLFIRFRPMEPPRPLRGGFSVW
jgi:hypothetical protein